jgi:hypothetical protein
MSGQPLGAVGAGRDASAWAVGARAAVGWAVEWAEDAVFDKKWFVAETGKEGGETRFEDELSQLTVFALVTHALARFAAELACVAEVLGDDGEN